MIVLPAKICFIQFDNYSSEPDRYREVVEKMAGPGTPDDDGTGSPDSKCEFSFWGKRLRVRPLAKARAVSVTYRL
jgi:hypothetical protein